MNHSNNSQKINLKKMILRIIVVVLLVVFTAVVGPVVDEFICSKFPDSEVLSVILTLSFKVLILYSIFEFGFRMIKKEKN